jgi:hypothetical protein
MQWLALAALADWLIARTLTRLAIFMPKSTAMVVVYQALGLAGQLATTLAGLLGLGVLGWIAWREWRAGNVWLPPVLLGLIAFSLIFLVVPASGWLVIGDHVLVLAAAGIIMVQTLRVFHGPASPPPWACAAGAGWRRRAPQESFAPGRGTGQTLGASRVIAILLPAAAFVAGRLYQAVSAWYTAMRWPGPPVAADVLFNLGELLVVLSAVGLWWVYGRGASWRMWLGAALPALGLAAMHLAIPSMTGILAIWSIGLTLYLPWPLYAASLWLAGVTVLFSLRQDGQAAWAILLLAAGGYAPQLSLQVFLSIIALWLLASSQPEVTSPTCAVGPP